ncbi:MAG: phosphate signaling complex protein PhoU [Treponema sp.]|jgi:phosphate transport system protein|nr:phosphate signaling complex protein PhoU [Treponema sp.]
MREKFDTQLKELNDSLIFMGAMCEDCITYATQALLMGTEEMAKRAIQLEKDIDLKEREIQALCMKLLLQQQPVAKDLRTISAALKMITDMERIGDQGSDIAEITQHIDLTESKNTVHIAEMADAVIKMVSDAISAFVRQDSELAKNVQIQDDRVDELFQRVKKELLDMICSGIQHSRELGEQALETLMIAKYLERIGDHTVNITEWVLYIGEN